MCVRACVRAYELN